MGTLDGRVAIITGGGRGSVGSMRCCSRRRAPRSSSTTSAATPTAGPTTTPAAGRPCEIRGLGGEAVANGDNVADWDGGKRLVNTALEAFGDLDILVNNAGILRDRMLVNMTEEEWDAVIQVHLKGHFVPTRWAAAYWREQAKAGKTRCGERHQHVVDVGPPRQPGPVQLRRGQGRDRVVHRSSARRSSRATASARTASRPGAHPPHRGDAGPRRRGGGADRRSLFDVWDPANVSRRSSPTSPRPAARSRGATFFVQGGSVRLMDGWRMGERVEQEGRWSVSDLAAALAPLAGRGT